MNEDQIYRYDYLVRAAELQDIAAMDRMAAELRPPSALRRWAEQRANQRRRPAGRRSA